MTDLLRAELLKLRTTRTFVGITGVAVGTSLLIALLVSILTEPTRDSVIVDVYGGPHHVHVMAFAVVCAS